MPLVEGDNPLREFRAAPRLSKLLPLDLDFDRGLAGRMRLLDQRVRLRARPCQFVIAPRPSDEVEPRDPVFDEGFERLAVGLNLGVATPKRKVFATRDLP